MLIIVDSNFRHLAEIMCSDFSTVKLLFPYFSILLSSEGHYNVQPALKGLRVLLPLSEGRVAT